MARGKLRPDEFCDYCNNYTEGSSAYCESCKQKRINKHNRNNKKNKEMMLNYTRNRKINQHDKVRDKNNDKNS